MVLSKTNNTNIDNPNVQQTTITTRTTEVPGAVAPSNVVKKDAVVTNVMEKPILSNVIEKKNVEVHHKPVVQEIHEQKIIEIEKQPVVQNVVQQPVLEQTRVAPVFEERGSAELGEQERLKLEKLRLQSQPIVKEQANVQQYQEKESVAEVVRQEFVERHVQPVVTEVREQNVVQEVVHPIVRTVHEGTIVREVSGAPMAQQQATTAPRTSLGYTSDTGRFAPVNAKMVPSGNVHQNVQNPNMLRTITGAGKNYFYGLSYAGELYHLTGKEGDQSWTHIPTNGILFKDISVGRGGALFGVGLNNGALYYYNRSSNEFNLVLPNDPQRLSQISVQSKRKIYALGEDGSAYFLKLARFGNNHSWERLGGKLKKISAGGTLLRRTELWGIGLDNRAYRWYENNWVPFNVELLDISVAMDNAVYGVSMDGRLLKWNGRDQFLLQDREIKGDNAQYLTNARLTGVSAYKEGKGVYGLEKGTSNVLRMIY